MIYSLAVPLLLLKCMCVMMMRNIFFLHLLEWVVLEGKMHCWPRSGGHDDDDNNDDDDDDDDDDD